ncbi:universal stress protein [Thiotrichales bacterium 19S11-10]|nr:universal stress protein [Thiotrichales bacterium 19S11-10]MCF6806786.1 universal stress protein [Thiotrichales bacterium 19S9-11]MCF6810755.1 universal stress protein [Thiotrichales bacterium 19S9-12]
MEYKNILVAINVYEDYHHVLNSAELIAKKFDASLTLLMVLDSPFELIPMSAEYQKELEKEAIDTLKQAASRMALRQVNTVTEVGNPSLVITDYAKDNQKDLIILGSHGKHGINLLLGSTSNSVLHRAPCDVLTIRITEHQPSIPSDYRKILIATDFEKDSTVLVDRAKSFAKYYQSNLNAITVQGDPTVAVSTYGIIPDVHHDLVKEAETRLGSWVRKHQINGKYQCSMGEAPYEITQFANEENMDLVVVGSHKKSAIGRFFLGSTANAILHQSKQDVLVVRLTEAHA